ncbi:50S ribosomal protein L32 [bacterium]|nr:50S ribosomal protein L32 [bacterium]
MSVPKKKRTKASKGKRRSHHALKEVQLGICPKCKKPVLPHSVCENCGTYRGREEIKVKTVAKK